MHAWAFCKNLALGPADAKRKNNEITYYKNKESGIGIGNRLMVNVTVTKGCQPTYPAYLKKSEPCHPEDVR